MRGFTVDRELGSNHIIGWNHQEFEVQYHCLSEEIKIGKSSFFFQSKKSCVFLLFFLSCCFFFFFLFLVYICFLCSLWIAN